jgi:hypothetical protein
MKSPIIFLLMLMSGSAMTQDLPIVTQQQMENTAEQKEEEPEDDSYSLLLEQWHRHPVDINRADREELEQFYFLTPLQVEQILTYRHQLGRLIHIYELQSIPGLDLSTIRKLLPFISLSSALSLDQDLKQRMKGSHSFLFRLARDVEKKPEFDASNSSHFLGDRSRIFFRYRYTTQGLLQWGLLGEKDAGEEFFKGSRRDGFDFYSFHLFARRLGVFRSVALGDYVINFGQGLIQWQGMALGKSSEVLLIKRQAPALAPYGSAGEFNFYRGLATELAMKRWQACLFISLRNQSANSTGDSTGSVSTILSSGLHRTEVEIKDRNQLQQLSWGTSLHFLQPRMEGRLQHRTTPSFSSINTKDRSLWTI